MVHEEFRELIILASLEELDGFSSHKLSQHLAVCSECSKEYYRMISFNKELSSSRPLINDNKLLESARRDLRKSIADLSTRKNISQVVKEYFFTYRLALGSFALFLIGIFSGLAISGISGSGDAAGIELLRENNVKISNISFIDSDPADGEISFGFDAVRPVTVRGKLTDNHIQQILAYSLVNERNDGIRLRAINTIAAQTMMTIMPGEKIKTALIKTVKYDQNPGVRREALLTLNRLPLDQDILNALLYVLENDNNSGLRIAAINSFDPDKLKSEMIDQGLINILQQKSLEEENEYIKTRARNVLEEVINNESL